MADSKITALAALAANPADGDQFVIVDVSDTSMAASGTDKKLAASFISFRTNAETLTNKTLTSPVINVGTRFNAHNPDIVGDAVAYGYYAHVYMAGAGGGAQNAFFRAGGTEASPTAVLSGMNLGALSFRGYTGAAFSGSKAFISAIADENWSGTANGTHLLFQTTANGTTTLTSRLKIAHDGNIAIGAVTNPSAALDLPDSSTSRASGRVRAGTRPTTPNAGDFWDDGALVTYQVNATTAAIVNSFKMERGSSGTPAAGFGLGLVAQLESSTTETQDAGRLTWEWDVATHASRASKGKLTSFYTITERAAITWVADSSAVKVGINQSSPEATLHVTGTILIDNAQAIQSKTSAGVARDLIQRYSDNNVYMDSVTAGTGGDYIFRAGAPTEVVRIKADGKVGIGTSSPQALLHGHDGSGGFLFVNRTGIDGTLVTVIPNGTGDVVTRAVWFGMVINTGGYFFEISDTNSPGSGTTYIDGANQLRIGVEADGSVTLQRTGGTETWTVVIWLLWR